MPKAEQRHFRKKLQKTYEEKNYNEVKKKLKCIRKAFRWMKESVVTSVDEGFEQYLNSDKQVWKYAKGRLSKEFTLKTGMKHEAPTGICFSITDIVDQRLF